MDNTKDMRKPKRKKKKFIIIPILFLACYAFLQVYLIKSNKVDTVRAAEGYINDSLISQGIVCRDEVIISSQINGVVDYLIPDGQRISKGTLLGKVYPQSSDLDVISKLKNYEELQNGIVTAQGYVSNNAIDVSFTRKQLTNQLTELSKISQTENFSEIYSKLTDITLSLNKINVATGKTTDFSAAKSELDGVITLLNSQISNSTGDLYSPYTGYFLQYADGYERIATTDNFKTLSYEDGQNTITSPVNYTRSANDYGKIITDYKWSICTYVDSALVTDLYEGKSVSVSLDSGSNEFQKATISCIMNLGEKSLVIADCTIMDTSAATTRITDCEILFKQYKGIKIPKSAVHIVEENMGVYIKFSKLVQFKKISPIFEDENYYIVPLATSEDNQVKLYDEIIVKGRNLYDGKYL